MKISIARQARPSLLLSAVPIIFLLATLLSVIALKGADAVQEFSPIILLCATAISVALAMTFTRTSLKMLWLGVVKSARQIMPAIPILIFIGTLSATWMLNGVVPTLIDYGLVIINPGLFLFITCAVCSVVSVVSGSSWTTIATIGVAFIGIGTVMGYSPAWVAGAIISGAYFGDKVSPLSDTTVLAASTCGIDLFAHIRFLMFTSLPAMVMALAVFAIVGWLTPVNSGEGATEMITALNATFNITPWVLIIPAMTGVFLALRLGTSWTLALSSAVGLAGIFVFQPQIVDALLEGTSGSLTDKVLMSISLLATETSLPTGNELLDSLVSTGGIEGMVPTILLVLSAMLFGGAMMGSGMLASITRSFTDSLQSPRNLVSATVGSGLFLNSCTGDQYLSIIIGGNLYRKIYARNGLAPKMLSRSLEDSISVTSVLIPWNSCGITQSTVLGVATLTYLPCCVFNYLSPLMSIGMAWIGFKIMRTDTPKIATT